jgi:signal transduction histidine kinase/DNA-binding NarL/FixJ family response regulator
MTGKQLTLGIEELKTEMSQGGYFFVAADEELLKQIPKGDWIGGTIPYFMTEAGGVYSRDTIYALKLPSYITRAEIKTYDECSLANVYSDAPDNGFSLMIIPASSKTHLSFALNAPKFAGFATSPLVGWISGVSIGEIGKSVPKVFDGRSGRAMEDAAMVMHATLPKGKTAVTGIVNIFEPSDGDALTFAADGFSAVEVIVNGKKEKFAEYLAEKKLDTRLPLVTNYGGVMINVSFQGVDAATGEVRFYAPVFENMEYRHAKPIGEYLHAFMEQKPRDIDDRIMFSCNCILNYVNSSLEGKHTTGFTGPITFGEIAYQLLNQTAVYIEIATANLSERLRDETAVRRLNRELREQRDKMLDAKREAEQASLAKGRFLANMSHEIRTPMTAILGYLELLSEGCARRCAVVQSEADNPLDVISRNVKHLLQIIDDILDVSKIEAGKMEVERVVCSPCEILAAVVSLMRVRASAKGLTLSVEYTSPMPESIRTDAMRLRQILINIIGNAIKFTKVGEVRLVAGLEYAPQGPMLQIQVVDTGIGISAEAKAEIFEAFTQADASTSREFGGTGLGLTLSKRLARLLGGNIAVESTLGKGSSFTLTVPTDSLDGIRMVENPNEIKFCGGKKERSDASRKPTLLSGQRLLLAEDGPDNQRFITFILTQLGGDVIAANNGQAAVEIAIASRDAGKPFDLILMDMQMPVLDGYRATQQLRTENWLGPIVALTANAMTEDRQKCLDAGCDDYLAKPIDRDRLIEVLTQWLAPDHAGCQDTFRSPDPTAGNPQALSPFRKESPENRDPNAHARIAMPTP